VPETEQTPDPTAATTRRSFYTGIIYAAWGAITAALAIPAGVYLLFPPNARKKADWIDASDLNSIPPDVPTEVSFQRRRVDGWKVTSEKATAWIVKKDESKVIAFAPQCTHLGCAYHWESQNHAFVCPCHNSEFSADGEVLGGPAPRPLDRYQVKIEAGRIKIGSIEPHA
jgi:menaquinol-cytochrome c reductase iron-sulfur subunit